MLREIIAGPSLGMARGMDHVDLPLPAQGPIRQLTDVMDFTFGNSVIKSCPMSYVNTVVNGNNGTKLTDLCISIFDYYSAAKDYLDYMASNAGGNETPVKQ